MHNPTETGDEDRYDILKSARAIVDGTGFGSAHTPQDSFKTLRKQLRMTLVRAYGPEWSQASVQEHIWPDGSVAYSASIVCLGCGKIHTQLATMRDDGSFDFAAQLEH